MKTNEILWVIGRPVLCNTMDNATSGKIFSSTEMIELLCWELGLLGPTGWDLHSELKRETSAAWVDSGMK